ncbi:MAG: hypothetical protein OXG85_10705 [Chloroflexi bacterium]|nr:hypothetical protein [Chloroflexota bacterium]
MAIDYIIEYDCLPQADLKPAGILERLKERARAEEIIQWFRAAGDTREPNQMGFDFTHSTPGVPGEKQLIVVQDLLDHAAVLGDYADYCAACPANRARRPFGCAGFIQYPISARAEIWLLERLPVPDEPLIWLLLKQGIQKLGYDGSSVKALRETDGGDGAAERTYFELPIAPERRLGELRVSGDQVLEMIFGVGKRIIPNHAGILLLFLGAIERDLEAREIQAISSDGDSVRGRLAFDMAADADADDCIRELIAFVETLYIAWKLNVALYMDA